VKIDVSQMCVMIRLKLLYI